MRLRLALILLLLSTAVAAGEPEELVDLLGAPDSRLRSHARSCLLARGPAAWPQLERARRSADPEVAGSASRILRAWGWTPPDLDGLVTPRLRAALYGTDGEARRRAVQYLSEAGQPGERALRAIFGGPQPTFVLEPVHERRTYPAGTLTLEFRVRNVDARPGWSPPGGVGIQSLVRAEFGRSVRFPGRRLHRSSHISVRMVGPRGEGLAFSQRTEWVLPRGVAQRTKHLAESDARQPGIYRVAVSGRRHLPARGQILEGEPQGLVSILNDLPFDLRFSVQVTELEIFVLPDANLWGERHEFVRLGARLRSERLWLELDATGEAHAPRDASSFWYLALNERDDVVASGPLVGSDSEPRRYDAEELVRIPGPERPLVYDLPLPSGLPETTLLLLIGGQVDPGGPGDGTLVVSNPIFVPGHVIR